MKAPMFHYQGLRCLRLTASLRLKTDTCEQVSLTHASYRKQLDNSKQFLLSLWEAMQKAGPERAAEAGEHIVMPCDAMFFLVESS